MCMITYEHDYTVLFKKGLQLVYAADSGPCSQAIWSFGLFTLKMESKIENI